MKNRWYQHWLKKAADQERTGDLTGALLALFNADPHTEDEDELKYLRIWRDRLKKAAIAKAGGK